MPERKDVAFFEDEPPEDAHDDNQGTYKEQHALLIGGSPAFLIAGRSRELRPASLDQPPFWARETLDFLPRALGLAVAFALGSAMVALAGFVGFVGLARVRVSRSR